jgi:hypothetical protein
MIMILLKRAKTRRSRPLSHLWLSKRTWDETKSAKSVLGGNCRSNEGRASAWMIEYS